MRLTVITLAATGTGAPQVLDGAQVSDLLWVAATAEDRLEHISVRCAPGRLHLGIFTLEPPGAAAGAAALDICRRALAMSPLLRDWSVHAVRPA
ncbi:hypothetical protein [Streptomyces albireticuli]|uniref:Uncharacterized protein n=1 Tax=Streptomyces albireticuli TaxID=1940 RepID=A0A2A2DAI7_9ACTN|nr:hypothetical protein [Streptomyces albireticuli]MCD9141331.1 hypothetical protein [Streptomyces albireticuli]MCD9160708.1 hypothetical protein [Streptomyces albireticuli]MCD9191235.1 hypothetical protein [Streptomyces albireticuli]PAU48380.1 hypothetical protein CK936_13560 [Streptomyces albireticuli]